MAHLLRPASLAMAVFVAPAWCAASPPPPAATTAAIFLPYYDSDDWSDAAVNETTYTIFCPTQTPPACDLALEFPFIVVEGPSTLKFHGTHTSTLCVSSLPGACPLDTRTDLKPSIFVRTANLECKLNASTAATCSGYSSYASGYLNAGSSGPTETSWTSTLSGSDVVWNALTLTETPTKTDDDLKPTDADQNSATVPSSVLYNPTATGQGQGAANGLRPASLVIVAAASLALFCVS
ncbi:hypothetical protein CDD82_5439 [Ophiocordyceps australis]|uniref:Uncharacterized protein n=1 Tax=Ophiocordyceps australis TaxID=1399860 RepID=A0A2C5ZWB8_9HYPO|nr:hypothetical protein CDD82_5439 [Ophiocordyceps australis]